MRTGNSEKRRDINQNTARATERIVSLSFTGTQLVKLLSSCFPDIDLRIVLKPARSLSGFFQFKDVIPKLMRSYIVYKCKCQCCGALYFSQSCRRLHTRISERVGISLLRGKKLTCSSFSAIQAHTRTTCHSISVDDFSILSYCNSASELLIKENLLNSKFKPEPNETIRSVALALF